MARRTADQRHTIMVPEKEWEQFQEMMNAEAIETPLEGFRLLLRLYVAVNRALFPLEHR